MDASSRKTVAATLRSAARALVRAYLPKDLGRVRKDVRLSDGDKGLKLARMFPELYRAFRVANRLTKLPHYPEDPEEIPQSFGMDMFTRWVKSEDSFRIREKLGIEEEDFPSFFYFEPLDKLDGDVLLKNEWLVHFTQNSDAIMRQGFRKGSADANKLGLTTRLPEEAKASGGFNFAYLAKDHNFVQKAQRGWHGFRFGNEVVVVRANGIHAYHVTDQQSEVIFWGSGAHSFAQVLDLPDKGWSVMGRDGHPVFSAGEDLFKAVQWVTKNYAQYRRALSRR